MISSMSAPDATIRDAVRQAYSAAARRPDDRHPFPVGRAFAEEVGYPAETLDQLPEPCAEAFAGVSYLHRFAAIDPGETVLDLGCGAGLDALIASRAVGPHGRVVGIDFSEPMLERACAGAAAIGATNVEFVRADAEALPFPDADVDAVLVNGFFNLNPARAAVFDEIARVLRPGGAVSAAELILQTPLSAEERTCESSWFA